MIEITEEQKYRARDISFAGFALMTPLGKIVLDPLFLNEFSLFGRVSYIFVSLVLFLFGYRFLEIGRDILCRGR